MAGFGEEKYISNLSKTIFLKTGFTSIQLLQAITLMHSV